VFFSIDIGECRERIVRRREHPLLKTPEDGLRALQSLDGVLVPPDAAAEGFDRVEVIGDDADAAALLEELGANPPTIVNTAISASEEETMFKFPRTAHIANLGSMTRGDKLLSPAELRRLIGAAPVWITEKVDGANLGFSIAPDGRIRVQNRGHYVDASYHAQFKPLDKWIARHTADLWAVLAPDAESSESGRYVLFGEWMYACHSVEYASLPDLFLAFDLYDRRGCFFLSYEALTARLAGTSLHAVPLIAHQPLASLKDAITLVDGPSAFGGTAAALRREGIVVRACEGERTVARGKLVAPHFLAGIDAAGRWNRTTALRLNKMVGSTNVAV
jgi:atypical dual specificity phosphatase